MAEAREQNATAPDIDRAPAARRPVIIGRDTGLALPWRAIAGMPLIGEIDSIGSR
jgi:hypothetical protein